MKADLFVDLAALGLGVIAAYLVLHLHRSSVFGMALACAPVGGLVAQLTLTSDD